MKAPASRPLLPLFRLCVIFFIISAFLLVALAGAERWSVRARWVPDGDTLYLETGQKIRLKGVDAPEMGSESHPEQLFARESRAYLWRLIEGARLTVLTEGLEADRFGRVVSWVELPDGRLVNEVMVEQGFAFVFPHSKQPEEREKRLLSCQRRAMNQHRGFWSRILSEPFARERYLGNQRSKRFHTRECRYGQMTHPDNRVEFFSLREAFYAGFAPGRRCTPWPEKH